MKLGQIALTFVVIAALSGCAVMDSATGPDAASPDATPAPADGAVSIMERSGVGGLPAGWEPWILHPKKRKTRYETRGRNGDTVVWAHADSAASGLARRLNLDPSATPWIEWRWRVDTLVEGADNTDRYAEDSPVRIVLTFDGDRSRLSAKDAMLSELARSLTGEEMPYATLMYVWSNELPVGTVVHSRRTDRIRKMVIESGPAGLNRWLDYERDIEADFMRAFGELPSRLTGVAIMTDTDNTGGSARAWYGPVALRRSP